MGEVLTTNKKSVKVAVSIEIMEHHLNFAKEIRDTMGKVAACKYIYHVYPKLSLLNAKTIVEYFL